MSVFSYFTTSAINFGCLLRIKSEKEFFVAFRGDNRRESDCKTAESGSFVGDFLGGAFYVVQYSEHNGNGEILHVRGRNQGVAGCPWEDATDARPGTNLEERKMVLWGRMYTFNERGWVYEDGQHVGYILFPSN
ncbi:MAG: hypothetical protein AB4290_05610 [Spirulina sp.]